MKKRSWKKRIIILAVILLVTAVLAYEGYGYLQGRTDSEARAAEVMEKMQQMVPGLQKSDDKDAPESSGTGRDPLVAMSIDGTDYVGCLSIPSLDVMIPVTSGETDDPYFAGYIGGSALKGKLRLKGQWSGAFMGLSDLKPGNKVYFIDMDGVKYVYKVTTQYHLKSWDEGDNDLLLCYESDDKTDFVVGCTKQ